MPTILKKVGNMTQKCIIECRSKDLNGLIKKYKTEGWKVVNIRRQPVFVAGRGKMVGFTIENFIPNIELEIDAILAA